MKSTFVLSDKVKKNSGFAAYTGFGVTLDIPKGTDLVVLAGNRGGGYEPYRCLLPGQIYETNLQQAFDDREFESIFAMPVRSDEPILVAARSEAYLKKWNGEGYSIPDRFRLTGNLKAQVSQLAHAALDVKGTERIIFEMMHAIEAHTKDAVKKAVDARDDQWEKQLTHIRGGLR